MYHMIAGRFGVALGAVFLVTGCLGNQRRPEPSNRLVILIDASISFRDRQAEAVRRVTALLDSMAQVRLHRWETASDSIAIVSLDAIPEVLWQGTLRQLNAVDRTEWAARFRARSDYAGCTDVAAAFRLAAQHLGAETGDAGLVNRYIAAFTDLIDEPPMASIRSCQPAGRPSAPPKSFPWKELGEVSTVVFWVPPEQKLVWRREVDQRGLGERFTLYTTAESDAVQLMPPPRPTTTLTEEERVQDRARLGAAARSLLRIGAGIALAVALLGLAVAGIAWRTRRRSVRRTPEARPMPPGRGRGTGSRSVVDRNHMHADKRTPTG
jgi:hypothetical protein